jgi:hypothetical protein
MSSIYSKKLNAQITNFLTVGNFHTCEFFISPFTCFLLEFNDSNVCNGNGKNLFSLFLKINY